ncbi:MAG: MOSC domain-containing protein [Anaerolineales bacterium]|nr:MOSC domain-containing protein [Anaerolineales bacterium]
MSKTEVVARVTGLYLYPVKSMRGVAVSSLGAWWYGFDGDRKHAFVRSGNPTGFPWLTARQLPEMLLYQPYFVDPAEPLQSAVRVQTPAGADYALSDPALSAELAAGYGQPIHLMQLSRGTFDCMPASIMSEATVAAISGATGQPLTSSRFRPNIVVATEAGGAAPEDAWLGERLVFGDRPDSPQIQAAYRTERCAMINLDPDSAARDGAILRAVGQERDSCAGIYGAIHTLGTIQIGDTVRLVRDEFR